jgi:hypothetical protein
MEKPQELVITKDVYQTNSEWNTEIDIAEQIILSFPTLSPESIKVLSMAILNKITQGVKYSDEMENMISTVFPKVVQGLKSQSKRLTREKKSTKSRNPLEQELEKYIDKNNLLTIPYKSAKDLMDKYGKNKFYDNLQDMISEKEISFPFIKYFEKQPEFFFKNLMNYQPKVFHPSYLPNFCHSDLMDEIFENNYKFNNKYTSFETEGKDYRNIDLVSDLFQEEVRLRAIRKDQKLSSYDDWLKRGSDLIEELMIKKKDVTPFELREMSHEMVKEATQFKPTVAFSVYKFFDDLNKMNGKGVSDKGVSGKGLEKLKILDFSAGWGDRLIAAMAYGAKKYIATDPNLDLRKGHLDMVKTFYPLAFPNAELPEKDFPKDFQIIYEPFQTANIPKDEKFNLIFTSPPFFDFETYSKHQGQSILQFPKFESWMKGFFITSLKKGWDLLETGGYMVIHIKDMKEIKVCEPMNLFIQGYLDGANFLGVLGTKGSSNKILPMWVWEKQDQTNEKRRNLAKKYMEKYYPQYL